MNISLYPLINGRRIWTNSSTRWRLDAKSAHCEAKTRTSHFDNLTQTLDEDEMTRTHCKGGSSREGLKASALEWNRLTRLRARKTPPSVMRCGHAWHKEESALRVAPVVVDAVADVEGKKFLAN